VSVGWSRPGAVRVSLAWSRARRWHARIDDSSGLRVAIAGCVTPWGALLGLRKMDAAYQRAARTLPR